MINAKEVAKISGENDKLWEEFQKKQDKYILEASKRGQRSAIWEGNCVTYESNEQEYRRRYMENGYYFKPIGICGGVMQRGDFICW